MMRFCPAFHAVQLMKQVRIGFIVTFSNPKKIVIVFGAKEPTNRHHHHHHYYYKYDTSYKPLVMYSFMTQTFQIFIPKIMQPLLHNKEHSPNPPSPKKSGGGGVTGYTVTGMMEGFRGFYI